MATKKQPYSEVQSQDEPGQVLATERVYGGTQEMDHDLFKLQVATMKRNVSFTDEPRYEYLEHTHFFHSIDSRGTKQEFSAKVGGHYHKVSVTFVPGVGFKAECSKPMRQIVKKENGRVKKSSIELNDDDHVHPVQYRGSQKIKPTVVNPEFAKLQSVMAEKEAAVPGVIES